VQIEFTESERMAMCVLIAMFVASDKAIDHFVDHSHEPPIETLTTVLMEKFVQPGVIERMRWEGIVPREPDYSRISPSIMEGLKRYVRDHIRTGDFLYAVLTSDLREAYARADGRSIETMFDLVHFCWNRLPRNCWGSRDNVAQWLIAKPAPETPVRPTSPEDATKGGDGC
jgi:hypothetical protein